MFILTIRIKFAHTYCTAVQSQFVKWEFLELREWVFLATIVILLTWNWRIQRQRCWILFRQDPTQIQPWDSFMHLGLFSVMCLSRLVLSWQFPMGFKSKEGCCLCYDQIFISVLGFGLSFEKRQTCAVIYLIRVEPQLSNNQLPILRLLLPVSHSLPSWMSQSPHRTSGGTWRNIFTNTTSSSRS